MGRRNIWKVLVALVMVIIIAVAVVFCVNIIAKNAAVNSQKEADLQAQITALQQQLAEATYEETLVVKAGEQQLVYGETNGIHRANLTKMSVTTTYPMVLYQVIDLEGNVVQNDYFQFVGEGEVTFYFRNVTENVSEIIISGYDSEGKQDMSQSYKLTLLD